MNDERQMPMDAETVNRILEGHMDSIMQLLEAMAAEVPDTDMMLAALLEGEHEQVRVAIIEKLRAMLRLLAAEKEKELEKFLDKEKRQEVERQRNIFLQWLEWVMSEETLRKIREAFLARPTLERQVTGIGHELAARGVLQPNQPNQDKRDLGELVATVPNLGEGQGKGADKGRK